MKTAKAYRPWQVFVSCCVYLCLLQPLCLGQTSTPPASDATAVPLRQLDYDKPIVVTSLSPGSGIAGKISCDDTGQIVILMNHDDAYTDATGHPMGHIVLATVSPTGELRQYPWSTVPGYTNIEPPTRYFTQSGKVYALVWAQRNSLPQKEDDRHREPSLPLMLVFGSSGDLQRTIPIDPALDPISFGVYANGDLLLVSQDTLNQRIRLTVMESTGGADRELRLFDNDALGQSGPSARSSAGDITYPPDLLANMLEIHSFGDDLLLVPAFTSGMPIVEINERGIVRTVKLPLPPHEVIDYWIDSGRTSWIIRSGEIRGEPSKDQTTGKVMGVGVVAKKEILEFNPSDGSLIRRITINPGGLLTACEHNGDYEFITTHRVEGLLEIVHAIPR